jgi:hypothetical protein
MITREKIPPKIWLAEQNNQSDWSKSILSYTEWPQSHDIERIEYLHYGSSKWTDFFIHDRGMFKLYIHKDMLRETLC